MLKNFTGSDGANPRGGVILSGSTLYGTTYSGGNSNNGVIFRINTDGTGYSVIKEFTGADGANPAGNLTLSDNTLYGATTTGGSSNYGTVFRLDLVPSNQSNEVSQVLFFDNFQQFANDTDLTSISYSPASGPASASVTTSVQNGSPTIKATNNFFGSTWAFFDNSVAINKNQYKGFLASVQTNQPLQITWKMWIQETNSGPGMFLFSVPVLDSDPNITYNPPLGFLDTGAIIALTNGSSPMITIGNWGSLAGTAMTNTLILDYPNRTFSYALNGQTLATLPLGPYFTNVVNAIYFNGFERSAGSLGNLFAVDDIRVEILPVSSPTSLSAWAVVLPKNPTSG